MTQHSTAQRGMSRGTKWTATEADVQAVVLLQPPE
jgi:hypothetical protein